MSIEPEHQAERVLWSGHQSNWYFLGHWIVGLLIVAALGRRHLFLPASSLEPSGCPGCMAYPSLALLILMAVVAFARRQRTYRVTNHRVISIQGRVVTDTRELRIQDIRSMNVSKGGITGLLGSGKVGVLIRRHR